MTMPRAWGGTAVLLLTLLATGAGAECPPGALLRAIAGARSARLMLVGGCDPRAASPADSMPGNFFGCPSSGWISLSEREVALLSGVFGQAGSFDCGAAGPSGDWSGDERGVLGIEFDSGAGQARMLLQLPGGVADVGLAGGVHYRVRGSLKGAARWRAFVGACADARERTPRAFLHRLLAGQAGAADPAAAPAAPDSNCSTTPTFGVFDDDPGAPEVLTRVEPEWPNGERTKGLDATVLVQVLVCRDGRVHDVRVVRSVPMLDEAAIAAVRQWVFRPARSNGKPIATWVAVPVRFAFK